MTVHERLHRIFRSVFGDEVRELRATDTAADIGGWDSTAHITLMFAVEEEFGVEFSAEQLGGFTSVGELERFLEGTTAS